MSALKDTPESPLTIPELLKLWAAGDTPQTVFQVLAPCWGTAHETSASPQHDHSPQCEDRRRFKTNSDTKHLDPFLLWVFVLEVIFLKNSAPFLSSHLATQSLA